MPSKIDRKSWEIKQVKAPRGVFKWFYDNVKNVKWLNENDTVYSLKTQTTWQVIRWELVDLERIELTQIVRPTISYDPIDVVRILKEDDTLEKLIRQDKELLELIRWEPGQSVKIEDVVNYLMWDEEFIKKVAGKPGEDWKYVYPPIKEITTVLKQDKEFISMTSWKPGKDWKSPEPVLLSDVVESLKNNKDFINKVKDIDSVVKELLPDVVNKLKKDKEFIEKTEGKRGEQWPMIDVKLVITAIKKDNFIVQELKKDKEFMEMIKWDKGDSPSIEDIAQKLITNEKFLKLVKWEKWDTPSIDAIIKLLKWDQSFIESVRWRPGRDWAPGRRWDDWESINIAWSPDGKTSWTLDMKEWDKYMSVAVWRRVPTIFRVVK